jgi:hypothetical protein
MEANEMNHPLEYELVAKEKVNRMLREGLHSQQVNRQVNRELPGKNETGSRLVRFLLAIWGGGKVKLVDAPGKRSIASLDAWEVRR